MLEIDPDKVCYIIARFHEFEEEELIDDPERDDDEDDFDLDHEEAFDELDGHNDNDPLGEELAGYISSLPEDEQIELIALTWVGRGDYGPGEWSDVIEAAADRFNLRTAHYLLGMPQLADYLEEGLAAFGLSCGDYEENRI
ncbi:DUF3775 domain-containing protein [Fodinicurvata halophila]|uniref:DUF3775 domain-containing protein n=1 Tax=Fodinicurvata halophila TaxID=1419723 RepID=A0ABV8UHA7_9PROT